MSFSRQAHLDGEAWRLEAAATYRVDNGKPAPTDKDCGITNDARLWATATMGNRKHPVELFLRVITASRETMKLLNALPKRDMNHDERERNNPRCRCEP